MNDLTTRPVTIDAARLTWDRRTPSGAELRAWLESLPGSEFATGLLILADALDQEPTRPEPVDLSDELDDLADCTKLFAEAMSKMKEAGDSVARKSVKRLPREWTDVDFEAPDHIWLNAFKCIRPTDEFAAEVGRSIIASAMQAHPKRVALTVNAS